ncbi:kelch-like protein 3 [Clytia hemisphaerica]|uniref:BTB domain-containing protein n=1 Tax=Clytia hemisphaerica TaxID=252671 RepID=A0A7M5UL44_9CNID
MSMKEVSQEQDMLSYEGLFSKPWQDSDAVLIVEEKELHVHSKILSIASPYFEKMFNGNFKESQSKRVTLKGKSFDLIEQMLKIIYPNVDAEFEFNTKLCDSCYPEANNKKIQSCEDCTLAEGLNSLCAKCVNPGTELCPKCKNYFFKSEEGRSQHFECLRNLSKLRDEYIISSLERIVDAEVLSMSKSLAGCTIEYTMELLELADHLQHQESADLCIQNLTSRLSSYGTCTDDGGNIRNVTFEKNISPKSKNKLKGLIMKKRFEQVEKEIELLEQKGDQSKTTTQKSFGISFGSPAPAFHSSEINHR